MRGRPFIVPIFIPFGGCPHRCVFCDQRTITGTHEGTLTEAAFHSQVSTFLSYRAGETGRRRASVQIAFYGGNFLGMARSRYLQLLTWAEEYVRLGRVDSIRFSTRPETIRTETLKTIMPFAVKTIELGVQSMDNRVLSAANRGHTAEDTQGAASMLREGGYRLGLQMMTGLPEDDGAASIATAKEIIKIGPDFVRIYPTVVLKGSVLAKWYDNGTYHPMSLTATVALVKSIYRLFSSAGIPVARMGLQASETLSPETIVAGPYHPAFGHLVVSSVFLDKAAALLECAAHLPGNVTIRVNPRRIADMRGNCNQNVRLLENRFNIERLDVRGDAMLADDAVRLETI